MGATEFKLGNSSYKYGNSSRLWNSLKIPFTFRIELMDDEGHIIELLEDKVESLNWSFKRLGGCDTAEIRLRKSWENYRYVTADYRLAIYINTAYRYINNDLNKVWQGYLVDKRPIFSDKESYELRFCGFSGQMSRIIIGGTEPYQRTQELIKATVADIMTNYVTIQTDVLYLTRYVDLNIDDTTDLVEYRPSYINFSQKAFDCISYLASICGDWDWGVDKNRYFYFRKPNTALENIYWYGVNARDYSAMESYEKIINRVWVKSSKNYSMTFERDTDLAVSASQTTENTDVACGMTTTFTQLKQTFTTTRKSISKIRLKVNNPAGGRYCGVGFDELMVDGDMETPGTANWTAYGIGSTATKSASYNTTKDGAKSLSVTTALPRSGTYQSFTFSAAAAGTYHLKFNYKIDRGDFMVRVSTITGVTETLVYSSERYSGRTVGRSFLTEELDFTTTGTYDTMRVYFVCDAVFMSKFFLDDVSMQSSSTKLYFKLIDNDTGKVLKDDYQHMSFGITQLPGQKDTTTEFDVLIHYFGCANDGVTNYALLISTTGATSDSRYFKFRANNAGGYSAGKLYSSENGSSWSDMSKDVWFKIYYNQSQELYDLREESSQQSPANDWELTNKYYDGYLSSKDRTTIRASLQLVDIRDTLDAEVPERMIGKVAFHPPGGQPLPLQTTKNDATYKYVDVEYTLGQSFRHSADFTLESVTIRGMKFGSPAGTVWIEIRPDDVDLMRWTADEVMNGASVAKTTSGLSASATDLKFTFTTPPELDGGRIYWLVICSNEASGSGLRVVYNAVSDLYTNGVMLWNENGTYNNYDYDLYFKLLGDEEVEQLVLDSISYEITENGMNASLNAGEPLPEAARLLKQLEHRIQTMESGYGF